MYSTTVDVYFHQNEERKVRSTKDKEIERINGPGLGGRGTIYLADFRL